MAAKVVVSTNTGEVFQVVPNRRRSRRVAKLLGCDSTSVLFFMLVVFVLMWICFGVEAGTTFVAEQVKHCAPEDKHFVCVGRAICILVLFVLAAIAACASVFALCRLCCNACMSLPACHPARDEQEEVIEMPETGGEHQGQQQREEEQQQPAISSKPRHELLRIPIHLYDSSAFVGDWRVIPPCAVQEFLLPGWHAPRRPRITNVESLLEEPKRLQAGHESDQEQ
jgi:hypothetical protein